MIQIIDEWNDSEAEGGALFVVILRGVGSCRFCRTSLHDGPGAIKHFLWECHELENARGKFLSDDDSKWNMTKWKCVTKIADKKWKPRVEAFLVETLLSRKSDEEISAVVCLSEKIDAEIEWSDEDDDEEE